MDNSELLEQLYQSHPESQKDDPGRLVRWTDLDQRSLQWQSRNEALGGMIAPGQTVLDVGCGTMALKSFLPEGCRYIPADIVKRSPECLVVDLNDGNFPTDLEEKIDVVVFSGVLEYLHDAEQALRWAAGMAETVLFSYALLERNPDTQRRTVKSGFFNHFDEPALAAVITGAGLEKLARAEWRKQSIFQTRQQPAPED